MTERDWLALGDHTAMLAFLNGKGEESFRKYHLLLVAYCRAFVPEFLAEEPTRLAVDLLLGRK